MLLYEQDKLFLEGQMKWHIPAALLTICSLALLLSIGLLERAADAFLWMVGFSAVLLTGFGVLFAIVWLVVALMQATAPDTTAAPPIVPPALNGVDIRQSEFGKSWRDIRYSMTYDENAKVSRDQGVQKPHRLTLPSEPAPKLGITNERWSGFRSIDQKKKP